MKLEQKRWLILAAGILANLCQGAAYASSIFAVPMLTHLGLLVMGPAGKLVPDMSKWALAFSFNLGFLPIGMLLSGKIADQKSPKLVVIFGGFLFGLGMFLAGFSNSFTWFCATFGIMMGIGSGAAYGAIVATTVRWFPDKKGLTSGLAVGALGFGPVIIVPVGMALLGNDPAAQATTVLYTMKVLGIAFLVIIGIASLIMNNPPAGYVPAGFVPKTTAAGKAIVAKEYKWTEMLATGKFWLLYILYVCGAFAGLMIISQAKPIAMDIKGFASPDAAKLFAGGVVQTIALFNAIGRVFWGFVSDWIGRIPALMLMFLITAVVMFLMPNLATGEKTIIIASILIGACFGGYLGTFPSVCADAFGGKNMAVNYALLFSGFSIAAILGPQVAGKIKVATGSYSQAFTIASGVAAFGFIVAIITHFVIYKNKAKA